MSDYIKREDAIDAIATQASLEESEERSLDLAKDVFLEYAEAVLEDCKSMDVVEVVWCEECKKWQSLENGTGICRRIFNALYWIGTDATDFCSFAERKDEEADK